MHGDPVYLERLLQRLRSRLEEVVVQLESLQRSNLFLQHLSIILQTLHLQQLLVSAQRRNDRLHAPPCYSSQVMSAFPSINVERTPVLQLCRLHRCAPLLASDPPLGPALDATAVCLDVARRLLACAADRQTCTPAAAQPSYVHK
jgi:putative component of membrane protein insertase Oxa1/YidC/SpoIIIJ protein YidD